MDKDKGNAAGQREVDLREVLLDIRDDLGGQGDGRVIYIGSDDKIQTEAESFKEKVQDIGIDRLAFWRRVA